MIAALALSLAGVGCVAPGARTEAEPPVGLDRPTFTPLSTDPATESPTTAVTGPTEAVTDPPASPHPVETVTDDPSPADTPPESSAPAPPPTPQATTRPPVRGVLADGTDDMRGLRASGAPDHADLRELALQVDDSEARIRIAFAGAVPEAADGDDILNVATYHDVTGDGQIDYEIWASLTSDGWGTSWFDIRRGTARFAAEDDVDVEVVDGVLVLRFPPSHLGGARSGRWLASSEWGTGLEMSTGASATDDAPDDRSGEPWPS